MNCLLMVVVVVLVVAVVLVVEIDLSLLLLLLLLVAKNRFVLNSGEVNWKLVEFSLMSKLKTFFFVSDEEAM